MLFRENLVDFKGLFRLTHDGVTPLEVLKQVRLSLTLSFITEFDKKM